MPSAIVLMPDDLNPDVHSMKRRESIMANVVEDAFRTATTNLNFAMRRDRMAGFYVRRRAAKLAPQHPEWGSGRLADSLLAERAVIMSYIVQKTTALQNGSDPKVPAHLDLAVMAKISSVSGVGLDAGSRVLEMSYR